LDVQNQVGQRWDQEIEQQLEAAKSEVALWSAQSRTSEYVLEEAEYGKRNKKLFPALIERVDYPYGFGRIQTADMIGWKGEPEHPCLAQLLAALRGHLGVGRQPFAANGAIDESRHGDADLRPNGNAVESATAVGRNKSAPAGVSGELTGRMPETVVARPYSGLRPILNSTALECKACLARPCLARQALHS